MNAELWPLWNLRVRRGDLELRYPDDGLLHELAELAGRGIHDSTVMPFAFPWSRGSRLEIGRRLLAYQWRQRSEITPENWVIELAVLDRGRPVGIQAILATSFPVTRSAESGSWLGQEFQGRGIGTAARELIVHLGFVGFDALEMTTSAWDDNAASNRVSRKLGYQEDGVSILEREGKRAQMNRYRLRRDQWEARGTTGIEVSGLAPVREFLGLESDSPH